MIWPNPDAIAGIAGKVPTAEQRRELGKALSGPVGFLSGGPGTGKTVCLAALIQATIEQERVLGLISERDWDSKTGGLRTFPSGRRVVQAGQSTYGYTGPSESGPEDLMAVVAPTGKAALRITESLAEYGLGRLQARTIHNLLQPQRNGHDGDGWGFYYNHANKLPCEYIFIDEGSMIDAGLANSLCSACETGTHILFAGDPYQLPPVGHGKPFVDLIAAGLPHGHFDTVHRYAGRIAHVCRAIRLGHPWKPSPKLDLDAESPENLLHIEARNADRVVASLMQALGRLESRGYDLLRDVQVICPLNESGPLARKALNQHLQERLNLQGRALAITGFLTNDKVVCTTNCWLPRPKPAGPQGGGARVNAADEEYYVANGDTGFVCGQVKDSLHVEFSGGRQVRVSREMRKHIELAYAISGHKSQGSQWKVALVVIDPSRAAELVANQAWYYTVLSRAQEITITIGQLLVMSRRCRSGTIDDRRTRLRELVSEWYTPQVPVL